MRLGLVITLLVSSTLIVNAAKWNPWDYDNTFLWLQDNFNWLKPNSGDDHDNPHAIRRGHWTAEAFKLSPEQIAKKNGFLFESHQTTTKDGYILTVFRIRNPKFVNKTSKP